MTWFTFAYLVRLEMWGLAVALVQGVLILASWLAWDRATVRGSASFRHRLACLHFAALAVLPALTVAILHAALLDQGAAASRGVPGLELPPMLFDHDGAIRLSLAVGALWLTGALWIVLRLSSEAARLARLPTDPAPAALVRTVRRLGAGWAVADVRLADVPVPQVFGLLRPVLLVPRELRLPAAERDAVLLHELAHVRRGDFGWNLVQRLILAALWFHPAAWVLYGRLSREREACCDALAVRRGASPTGLARALVRLAETNDRSGFAMALSGRSALAGRVHRLLGLNIAAKPPAGSRAGAMALSALCFVALGAGRMGLADPAVRGLYIASAFGPTLSINARDAAGAFAVRIREGRVIGASVEQQPLPPAAIVQEGERVTLMGDQRQPIVSLTVTPQGRIRWQGRT